jgi:DNA invertase Pin-like site-specific DNA recombinase
MDRNGEKQKAALYIRVSKEEQAERYGPKYQLHDLRRWADQLGYEVVEPPIEEPGYSREGWNRPGLDKIRELAEAGEIDAV